MDTVWKWLGFLQKTKAKSLLEKHFKIDVDYKIFAPDESGAKKGRGGHNIKKILMTVRTFKSFCLKASTKKADEIHEYYLKLEELLQDVISEESAELKAQLEQNAKLPINQNLHVL